MYQQAVSKLKSEIEQSKNNPYVQVVGNFLVGHLDQHHEDAEKIMTADKTIGKSLEAMKKEASKNKIGNCAVLTDQEGFTAVLKYFDIKSGRKIAISVTDPTENITKPVTTAKKSEVDFNISLDDFL